MPTCESPENSLAQENSAYRARLATAENEIDWLRKQLTRTLPILLAVSSGRSCSMAAGDLYRELFAHIKEDGGK